MDEVIGWAPVTGSVSFLGKVASALWLGREHCWRPSASHEEALPELRPAAPRLQLSSGLGYRRHPEPQCLPPAAHPGAHGHAVFGPPENQHTP